ncbi:HpcH/HpaI aldolase/citrate lyase family protein [Streptantibioticus cattleyicolor]|uniref:HpcH/HpaI aldolase/citrate lyase family protein n=1 Tax=Streptantibioticus cattleyicolor (strain ATCC 35852 / DSM 46488 / JCM 4925 / NBRC 14057 / NRRL 8057) TaxID=1003195 RepID=F8JJY7_STREN|nr:CoA ester lyase [Streptantibioticus cattleyicolor]AEW98582.1 HpcH/HpaI aldolase/citrate lyase family protein [Streptantibioticus cattleyicolor NRRL 8057 = DSM 46488]CCB72360.1 putative citrate lyase [Streptantibioticus cattleyicolor NRRL 8057 = DSM 46488]
MSQLHRSYLYVPAHRGRFVEKAYDGDADAVVLDLEDGVPSTAKDEARKVAEEILSGDPPKPTYVRVNGPGTPWCRADIEAVAAPALRGLRLPKCERTDDIRQVSGWLDALGCRADIHLLIESAYGVEHAFQLVSASSRISMIGLGEADLRADLFAGSDEYALDLCRSKMVLVSRAAGLASPAQSVYPAVRDLAGLRESCTVGKAMGFFGRFAIHPDQIPVIHDVYSPTVEEIEEARLLIEALNSSVETDSHSVHLRGDGQLVAPPVIAKARRVLQLADALQEVAGA